MSGDRSLTLARAALWGLVALCACLALVALTVPYHHTDAQLFGEWSRQIAAGGGLHIDDVATAWLQRPLFYIGQGLLWQVFGFSEWSGRLISLGFGVLLAWSVIALGRAAGRASAVGALAACLLIACPDYARDAFGGQTDVPVVALVGACGVLLWRGEMGRGRMLLLTLGACAAVLAKPSALPTLAGLGAAALIGGPTGMTDRVRRSVIPLLSEDLLGKRTRC